MVLRKSFYIRWSAGRSPRVHEVNSGRDPSGDIIRGHDKGFRSQQERSLGQTKAVATRENLLRHRRGFKERSCHDTVLYVATWKEDNYGRNR